MLLTASRTAVIRSLFLRFFLVLISLCLCFICVGEGDLLTHVLKRRWPWAERTYPTPPHKSAEFEGGEHQSECLPLSSSPLPAAPDRWI